MMINVNSWKQGKLLFLNKFLRSPRQIGSVTPSSKFLAKKMLESVPWNEATSVAELGAGTGAITKYIQAAKKKATKVILFEKDPYMREQLQEHYPEFSSYEDSSYLQASLHTEAIKQLDCIISGLPFSNFPQTMRDKLMEQILVSLKDDGLFIAFQYSLQMRSQLKEHFEIEKITFVPLNVPPAFVYVCRKKEVR
ncbi:Phospholipid N-methyltransferase [Paenibacillus algorifonticola]|uniref:Phospholipid N-methyltransferase n=2 Tax=Paenibacillus algorifonticola TaxID=684063 RepID=A0A1I2ELF8_9BACL|nr:Phospholipid N-methyltransferase [Paenibacillus algorifonticola]